MLRMIDDIASRTVRTVRSGVGAGRGPKSLSPMYRWALFSICSLILLVPGLAKGQEDPGSDATDPAPETPSYIIGKEDVLQIDLYGETELSGVSLPVRPDGRISLPLIGDVRAAGLTPEQLSESLTVRYSDHVRAPVVTVMVAEVNSFKVYLLGKLGAPGEISLGRETRLLQVLALAGGLAEFANTKHILIIRERDGGGQERIEVNYEKIISGVNMEMNLKLKPGDTIVVP
jgi:polysaccharide export outer membrane protein